MKNTNQYKKPGSDTALDVFNNYIAVKNTKGAF